MKLTDLLVGVAVVRLDSQRKDFPQDDAETPDVGFEREFAVQDRFRRHPTDGQHPGASDL